MKTKPYRCPSCNSHEVTFDKQNRMHCMSCGTVSEVLDLDGDNPDMIHARAEYRRADADHVRARAEELRAKANFVDANTRRRSVDHAHNEYYADKVDKAFSGFFKGLGKVLIHIFNALRRPLMIVIWVLMFPLLWRILPWPSLLDGFFSSLGQWLFNALCFLALIIGGPIVIIKLWSNHFDLGNDQW